MRLLVSLEAHLTGCGDEVYSHNLSYEGFWRRYLMAFDEVHVLARVARAPAPPANTPLASGPGVHFHALPDYLGPWQFLRKLPALGRVADEAVAAADAFMLRVPGAVSDLVWKRVRARGKPFGIEVVGDPWDSLGPGGVKTFARPVFRRLMTRRLRLQSRHAATSAYVTAAALQKRYPPAPGTFTTHYSSVELPDDAVLTDLAARLERTASIPARLRAPGEPVRLGFIGTFNAMYKAPDAHIEALAQCARKGLNVALDMVGEGQHLGEMQQLAASLGVSDRVRFLGRLNGGWPIFGFLDTVDLFLNASRQEGLPRALIEAMARGCAGIGSEIAGIPELLGPTHLVPPNDPHALAERIAAVLQDAGGLAEASRRNVGMARDYTVSVLTRRRREHFEALRAATDRHGGRGGTPRVHAEAERPISQGVAAGVSETTDRG